MHGLTRYSKDLKRPGNRDIGTPGLYLNVSNLDPGSTLGISTKKGFLYL